MRKQLELLDLIIDDKDEDWSFIPQAIIDHRKKKIPRSVIITTKEGKLQLKVEETSYMRIRVK